MRWTDNGWRLPRNPAYSLGNSIQNDIFEIPVTSNRTHKAHRISGKNFGIMVTVEIFESVNVPDGLVKR